MSTDLVELLNKYLPNYLTESNRESLVEIIKNKFPNFDDAGFVYTYSVDENLYQGDCIDSVPFFLIRNDDGAVKSEIVYFPGIVVSNTCSINPDNERFIQPDINFAQVYSVKQYRDFLLQKPIEVEKIDNHIRDLKTNRVFNIIYLPKLVLGQNQDEIFEESFIRLDKISSLPNKIRDKLDLKFKPEGDKYFTFSDYGFYVFLLKLSTYFCRFSENVNRMSLSTY